MRGKQKGGKRVERGYWNINKVLALTNEKAIRKNVMREEDFS